MANNKLSWSVLMVVILALFPGKLANFLEDSPNSESESESKSESEFDSWSEIEINSQLKSTGKAEHERVLACYWKTESHSREYPGNFSMELFPADLCTHLIYSFVSLKDDGALYDEDATSGTLYSQLVAKKRQNVGLKTLLAVGGAGATAHSFSVVANASDARKNFIRHVELYMTRWEFDGLVFDWEYPGDEPGYEDFDKVSFVQLAKETRTALTVLGAKEGKTYTISAAVAGTPGQIDQRYNIPELAKVLDHIHLMTYNLKEWRVESTDNKLGHHAPLFAKPGEIAPDVDLTVDAIVEAFKSRGAAPSQLIVGVATYGKSYELKSRTQHNFGDQAQGPGPRGPFFSNLGSFSYAEICHQVPVSPSSWEFYFDEEYQIPYAFNSSIWVGYDDEESVIRKTDYAEEKGLGGMMIWSIENDDCNNLCGGWNSCPLISAVKRRQAYHNSQSNPNFNSYAN